MIIILSKLNNDGSDGKESACNSGDLGLILGSGSSLKMRKWQHTPVFLPGKSHGQRSLVGSLRVAHTCTTNTTSPIYAMTSGRNLDTGGIFT